MSTQQVHAHTHHAHHTHAVMVADLDRLTSAFAESGSERDRSALLGWFAEALVPHAAEEEVSTYAAAAELPEGRLLVEALTREHVLLRRLVGLVGGTADPVAAAAYGRAVLATFESHQRVEDEVVLPLLSAA